MLCIFLRLEQFESFRTMGHTKLVALAELNDILNMVFSGLHSQNMERKLLSSTLWTKFNFFFSGKEELTFHGSPQEIKGHKA